MVSGPMNTYVRSFWIATTTVFLMGFKEEACWLNTVCVGLAAGLAMAMYLAGNNLRQIFFYLLGSFASSSWAQLAVGLPIVVIGCVLIMGRARSLTAVLLDDSAAPHRGLNVGRQSAVLLALASLVTAAR